MESLQRKVKSGKEFDHLFPEAKLNEITIKRNSNLADTLEFIPKVVKETQWQTKKIASLLKGKNTTETCSNIWHFVYQHINYSKDEDGYEQIRSPARTWKDRFQGVDCDCYSTFISTILSNLHIAHQLRITKYKTDSFQHIYPIVPLADGSHITIDCVVHQFNYEEPYSAKKDYHMNLQYLNGTEDDLLFSTTDNSWEENDLGKLKLHLKDKIKKGIHLVNRINPGATLLRNGVLASLKLNLFKVAQRLKWAYLTPEQAQQKGILSDKYNQLVAIKNKLEKIYFSAGGKPENFRHALLKGKGNKRKEVAVFGLEGMDDVQLLTLTPNTTVEDLVGFTVYQSENEEEINGLGEPVSASAAIAAASGLMASIAAVLKGVGNIFHPSSTEEGKQDFDENAIAQTEESTPSEIEEASRSAEVADAKSSSTLPTTSSNSTEMPTAKTTTPEDNSKKATTTEAFWEKNKTWIKPVAAIATGVTLITLAVIVFKPKPNKVNSPTGTSLNGTISSKRKSKKAKHTPKRAVALM